MNSMLYPRQTICRRAQNLDGMWKIVFDPEKRGIEKQYHEKLPGKEYIPVPSSFADFYTDKEIRDYCGDFWYETQVFVPREMQGQRTEIRFAAVTHRARVFVNGVEAGAHEGGFLPFCVDVTDRVSYGAYNRVTVLVNNELNETSLPNGTVKELKNGRKKAVPYFDFFNYSGIIRSVTLVSTPHSRIADYSLYHELHQKDSKTFYQVEIDCDDEALTVEACLYDEEGSLVSHSQGRKGTLEVKDVHLWEVRNAYLYRLVIRLLRGEQIVDEYYEDIGIRTVEVRGIEILLNDHPVYLKGFGKHEDSPILGRGFCPGVMKRDFELMKWIGANSFRTSHYPYAEETYQMADREGFLIIDEVAAVGFVKRSGMGMFTSAGKGEKPKSFFHESSTPALKRNHMQAIGEMIQRDKNHASVIAWSLFNEPETMTEEAGAYFKDIFEYAKENDVQKRPCTFAMELSTQPEHTVCHQYCDILCMNRYYGWYVSGGLEISDAKEAFLNEMDRWAAAEHQKPMIFTEYGTDTCASEHKLPSVMWSQEYQVEYYEMYHEIFDKYDFVCGEQVWNFADFQTGEGIARVDGNKKGIFTRDRQPKDSAYLLRERWTAR